MAADRRTESRRGLAVIAVLLVVFLLAVDLLRSDSAIRGFFQDVASPSSTPLERMLDRVTPP